MLDDSREKLLKISDIRAFGGAQIWKQKDSNQKYHEEDLLFHFFSSLQLEVKKLPSIQVYLKTSLTVNGVRAVFWGFFLNPNPYLLTNPNIIS